MDFQLYSEEKLYNPFPDHFKPKPVVDEYKIVKRKLIVFGFYGQGNLGDEMFKETLKILFPEFDLDFSSGSYPNWANYHAVVCGGGDILNSYFIKSIRKLHAQTSLPFYAVGVGIPYPSYISSGFTALFQKIWTRNKTDLPVLREIMGYDNVTYIPDLGFLLPSPNITPKKRILICPATPMLEDSEYFNNLVSVIGKLADLDLYCVRFNSSGLDHEDDTKVIKKLLYIFPQITYDDRVYSPLEMIEYMASFELLIASRFHSHVFSLVAHVPFISVATTRKVSLFIDEYIPSSLVITNFQEYQEKKHSWEVIFQEILPQIKLLITESKIEEIISRRICRKIDPKEDTEILYLQCREVMMRIAGYDPEIEIVKVDKKPPLSKYEANLVGKEICRLCAGEKADLYEWGTINNLQINPENLRQMVYWIRENKN